MTLEAVRGKMLASVAMPEIRLVQDEVDNWHVITELTAALTAGGAGGELGKLDLSAVSSTGVERAVDRAEELGVKTAEAAALVSAAQLVFRLRTALLRDAWGAEDVDGVEAVLREAAAAPHLSDLVKPEVGLVQAEADNRRIVLALSAALAAGAAKGGVGELDLGAVDTAALDTAITTATELGVKTEDASRLLAAAKLIRRLRSVLVAGNWQWVGSVLLEARGMKDLFPQVSLKELQLAQDELDNRAIIAQLSAALRVGGPAGAVGHIAAAAIDTDGLDEAIAYARTLGVKSAEASQIVATAQAVRKLRAVLKAGDFSGASEVLESLKGKMVAAVAADEVQLARLNVDNWYVIGQLTAALSAGASHAVLGDVDVKAINLEALDVAVAAAMKLGCQTLEARRCLVTALIIRRLRAALVEGDLAFLAQVVKEADGEAEAILPVARAEVQRARDLLAFREVMTALARAMEAQDEAGLVEVLARAARLNLGGHPKPAVRETVEAATLALGRIQRCKAALAAGIKNLEAAMLIDALAMAAAIGYSTPLVEEAKHVLATVQALQERAATAFRNMEAVDMTTVLRDCDAIKFAPAILDDIRAALALPRPEFLRRELAAVLAAAAAPGAPAALHAPVGVGARAPTPVELRVVVCTLQLKDLFFAEREEGDGSGGGVPAAMAAASPLLSAARVARNTEDNVKGAAARAPLPPALGNLAWAAAGEARAVASFRPGGSGSPSGSGGATGGAVPPPASKLRRQFDCARAPALKPPHMFSRKYGVADTSDTGLLRWQHEPIHTSLSLLQDAEHRRAAVKCFRDILAFMGDRPLARPMTLACELIDACLRTPELRDEVLLQLVKQLTGNPSVASLERGWVLLHLALMHFPPSEDLENHVELFLRERGALPCVWAMHLTLYRGGSLVGAPTPADVQACLERARAPPLPALSFDPSVRDDSESLAAYNATVSRITDSDAAAPMRGGAAAAPPPPVAAAAAAGAPSSAPLPGAAPAAAAPPPSPALPPTAHAAAAAALPPAPAPAVDTRSTASAIAAFAAGTSRIGRSAAVLAASAALPPSLRSPPPPPKVPAGGMPTNGGRAAHAPAAASPPALPALPPAPTGAEVDEHLASMARLLQASAGRF